MSQRVAYVLREAFDYSYQGTAYVLKLTEANYAILTAARESTLAMDAERP